MTKVVIEYIPEYLAWLVSINDNNNIKFFEKLSKALDWIKKKSYENT